MAINPEKCQHLDSSVDNIDISLGHFKVIPFNCIAHPFCASIFA